MNERMNEWMIEGYDVMDKYLGMRQQRNEWIFIQIKINEMMMMITYCLLKAILRECVYIPWSKLHAQTQNTN